jgi:hypothetical protein
MGTTKDEKRYLRSASRRLLKAFREAKDAETWLRIYRKDALSDEIRQTIWGISGVLSKVNERLSVKSGR